MSLFVPAAADKITLSKTDSYDLPDLINGK